MRNVLIALCMVALLALAACTAAPEDTAQNTPMDGAMGGSMNDAMMSSTEGGHTSHMMAPVTSEEQFIVEMIPHHQEAVDTSRIVAASSENDALITLAQEIITAQEREIQMMEGWLDERFYGGHEPMYMNMMGNLEAVSGAERDVLYLEGMIMHHEMAVKMAREVLKLDPAPEVVNFANDVIDVQTSEIEQMKQLLTQYR